MSAFLQSAVKQLMLVDDDQDNLDLFTIILEYAGFSVKKYSESVKALKEFKSNFYDLVILDYLMPYLDGMQLYNKVKELDSSIKAILLTGSLFDSSKDKPQLSNSDFKVLTKPVTVSQLVIEVRSMLCLEKQNVLA